MTHPHVPDNPFDKPAEEAKGKMAFGELRIITNKVNLTTGASYVVDALGIDPDSPDSPLNRLTYEDGNLREFKGKQLAPSGRNTHIIVVITRRDASGRIYNDSRDFMYWQNDVCYKVTFPSLAKFFGGPKLPDIWGKSAQVQAEVIREIKDGINKATGEPYMRQAFKIVKRFKDQAEREAAETAFFSQFQQTPDQIADDIPGFEDKPMPWGDDGKPVATDDKPVGMTKEAAVALLPTLWVAATQDKDKFLTQLNGMPVVLVALGGIDAPEIAAVHSPEQDAIPS